MTKKELNDKIEVETLLNIYSVKDISNTFAKIDEKLMSLFECSADDFRRLNSDFKNLYKQSEIISDNVNTIFDIYNTNKNKELYTEIHNFYNGLKDQVEIFDQKIFITMEFLVELSNILRYIFFPIKDFGQNLMSLKFLLAHLNLLVPTNSDLSKQINLLEEEITKIKTLSERISKSLNHLRKISKISYSNFSQVKNQSEINIETLLSNVKSKINSLEEKYNNDKKCVPKIRRKNNKSADSLSDIIKKLQYQDIIKQKMEHIQQTHKDLISELSKFENTSNDEEHLNDKAKFFLRIRDIAGLQAAQLIQTNREYQSAIKIIINNFVQVGDNMSIISEMCGDVMVDKNEDEIKLFEEIVDQVVVTEKKFINKFAQNKKLNKDVSLIDHQLIQAEKYFAILNNLNQGLNQNMESFFDNISKYSSTDTNVLNSLNQIRTLFYEIKINGSNFEELIVKLYPIKERIQGFINEQNKLSLYADFEEIKDVLSRLQFFKENIDDKLKENHDISNEALESIKKSISEIKYYDYFEQIMEEIITELNTINFNLKTSSNEIDDTIDDNLSKLKEYYTMETEHVIHDQVSKGEDTELEIDNDEDGDIEFF